MAGYLKVKIFSSIPNISGEINLKYINNILQILKILL